MRVSLIKPSRGKGLGTGESNESLSLGYLAGALRRSGHSVDIVNASLYTGMYVDDILKRITDFSPGLIGISISDPTLVFSAYKIIKKVRINGFDEHITVGGYTATFHWKDILKSCKGIDSIVLYDGEIAICELAAKIKQKKEWRGIPGIAYATEKSYVRNKEQLFFKNLDDISFPARDDLKYVISNFDPAYALILASRGCKYNCAFCSVGSYSAAFKTYKWRRRSVNNVLNEIQEINADFGLTRYQFVDDLFIDSSLGSKRYAKDFAIGLLKRGLSINYFFSATVDSIDSEMFMLLKDSGLSRVLIGAESASFEILKYFDKRFDTKKIISSVEILTDLGIDISLSWINFTPITRMKHLRESLMFFLENKLDLLPGLLNRYQVYSGSRLFYRLKASGLLRGEFPYYDFKCIDPQVDYVYSISKNVFKPFLILSEKLKEIELKLSSLYNNYKTTQGTHKVKAVYELNELRLNVKNIKEEMNSDAAKFFSMILDISENEYCLSPNKIDTLLVDDLRKDILLCCDGWLRTIKYLEEFCIAPYEKEIFPLYRIEYAL